MKEDNTRMGEHAGIVALLDPRHDAQRWHCYTVIERFRVPEGLKRATEEDIKTLERFANVDGMTSGEMQKRILLEFGVEPETEEVDGNLLMYGGASNQWQTLIGNGTTTAGQNLTYFSNAQAAIGVGDSTTAAAATQTDLQAATNKLRVAMDSGQPAHTDGVVSGSASITFKSTFSTAQANWAWQEWGIFNSSTAATGRMLNRKVESLGTKTSAAAWALTLTLTLA